MKMLTADSELAGDAAASGSEPLSVRTAKKGR
jgi:hypothetical protein